MAIKRTPARAGSGWRRLATAVGLTALVATGGAVFATPASADYHCDLGYHCVFWSGYDSARHRYFNSDTNFTNDTFNDTIYGTAGYGEIVNDNAYSASNYTSSSYYSKFYLHINYGGNMLLCLAPGAEVLYRPALLSASSLQLSTTNPGGCT